MVRILIAVNTVFIVCQYTYYNLSLSEVNHSFYSKLYEKWSRMKRALYLCVRTPTAHMCIPVITVQGTWNLSTAHSTVQIIIIMFFWLVFYFFLPLRSALSFNLLLTPLPSPPRLAFLQQRGNYSLHRWLAAHTDTHIPTHTLAH